MLIVPVHERGDRAPTDIVDPTADKREVAAREIGDRRGTDSIPARR
jgi:hypothetical protein